MTLSESLDAQALRELGEMACPGCGGRKFRGKSFCAPCYYRLPGDMRRGLYNAFGAAYSLLYDDAKQWLKEHKA